MAGTVRDRPIQLRLPHFRRVIGAVIIVSAALLVIVCRQQFLDASLIHAVKYGDRRGVLTALAAGANPNARGSIERQIPFKDQVVKLIRIKPNAGPMSHGRTAPALCAYVELWGDTDVVTVPPEDPAITEALLKYGARVDSADDTGISALGWAIALRRDKTARLLLDWGANPSAVGRGGGYVAHLSDVGSRELVVSEGGRAPVVVCAFRRHHGQTPELMLARLLIARGADPNASGADGETPLWSAVCAHDLESVSALIERGADVNATANNGRTILNVVKHNDRLAGWEFADVLKRAGAKE